MTQVWTQSSWNPQIPIYWIFYLLWIRPNPIILKLHPSCLLRMFEDCDWLYLMDCVLKATLCVHNHSGSLSKEIQGQLNFTITDESKKRNTNNALLLYHFMDFCLFRCNPICMDVPWTLLSSHRETLKEKDGGLMESNMTGKWNSETFFNR